MTPPKDHAPGLVNFLHRCRRCSYEVVLPQDDSRHSVCPKCPTDSRFKVTMTDQPAIDETYAKDDAQ